MFSHDMLALNATFSTRMDSVEILLALLLHFILQKKVGKMKG
jgi:hypothetical protein